MEIGTYAVLSARSGGVRRSMSGLGRTVALLVGLLGHAPAGLASPQAPDRIRVDGEVHYLDVAATSYPTPELNASPLEPYFELGHPRPPFDFWSTGHWRGYEATWEIDGGMLYLIHIRGHIEGRPAALADINRSWQDRVPATWFTGTLEVKSAPPGLPRMRFVIEAGRLLRAGIIEPARPAPGAAAGAGAPQ